MQNKGFLQTKEIFAIVLLLVATKLTDSTPALLAQETQNAFWLSPIISFVCIFPSFMLMIYLLKKYQDKNLVELLEAITTKWVGKLLGIIIFLFGFLTIAFDSRNYIEQTKLLYFPESPTLFIYLIFMLFVFLGAKKGIEVIGYTSWISLPIIKVSALFVIIFVFGELVYQRIFPLFGTGISTLFLQGLQKSSLFAELFFLLIAYQAAKKTSMFRKAVLLGAIISSVEITIFYFVYTTVFDYNSINKIAFPYHDITQFISIGTTITNIETIFMIFWLLASFVKFIIFLYLVTWIFGATFSIRNFEPLLLPFSFLIILIGLMPFNASINELVWHNKLLTIMSPFFILLPIILWLIAWMKGDLKNG